jgi:hypothetical protein
VIDDVVEPAVVATPARSHKRAKSDPGEKPAAVTAARVRIQGHATARRVTASHPSLASEKRATRQDEQIARLLEETHSRRLAAASSSAVRH